MRENKRYESSTLNEEDESQSGSKIILPPPQSNQMKIFKEFLV